MEWKEINQRYGTNPHYLFLNKLHVATVAWDYGQSKTTTLSHRADVHLPGMKEKYSVSRHSGIDEAKEYAEKIVKKWVGAAGLEFKDTRPNKLVEFEKLQGDDLYSFVEQHNPSLVERKSHHPEMIKKYGEKYWSFLLDNGIGICISANKEEAIEKFNVEYKKP